MPSESCNPFLYGSRQHPHVLLALIKQYFQIRQIGEAPYQQGAPGGGGATRLDCIAERLLNQRICGLIHICGSLIKCKDMCIL